MFGKKKSYRPREDPAVALVESILGAAAAPMVIDATSTQVSRVSAARAMWICACETIDDAPVWLIYDTDEGEIGWCRVPNRVDEADIVDARVMVGGHSGPRSVLVWLQGDLVVPYETEAADRDAIAVVDELRRKFVPSPA